MSTVNNNWRRDRKYLPGDRIRDVVGNRHGTVVERIDEGILRVRFQSGGKEVVEELDISTVEILNH